MLRSTILNSDFLRLILFFILVVGGHSALSLPEENNAESLEMINRAVDHASSGLIDGEKYSEKFGWALDSAESAAHESSDGGFDFEIERGGYSDLMSSIVDPLSGQAIENNISSEGIDRFGFSNEEMAKIRMDTLNSFGIDRGIQGFIFVSSSMQKSLIRAYSLQAEKFGFQLIFKGPPKGRTDIIGIMKEWGETYHTSTPLMAIQMDPRLFDSFQISQVPTLVLTKQDSLGICRKGEIEYIEHGAHMLPLHKCSPIPENQYCKISGPLTLDWAIEYMAKEGCDLASKFIDMIRENSTKESSLISDKAWAKAMKEMQPSVGGSRYSEIVMKQLSEDFFE